MTFADRVKLITGRALELSLGVFLLGLLITAFFMRGDATAVTVERDPSGSESLLAVQGSPVEPITFKCAQSRRGDLVLEIDSSSGDYRFIECAKGLTVSGKGEIKTESCRMTLKDGGADSKNPDRMLSVLINQCTKTADVKFEWFATRQKFAFIDTDVTNNKCSCP
jgi:hypothetical protein